MKTSRINISLYEQFKDSPKKLKIVCDWDEVIQATEPYCLYLAEKHIFPNSNEEFETSFQDFWCLYDEEYIKKLREQDDCDNNMEYSAFGSEMKDEAFDLDKNMKSSYEKVAGSPDLYQKAPFLTIAEDLLKLIKEDKVEWLIFLSTSDDRKREVFKETFGKLDNMVAKVGNDGKERVKVKGQKGKSIISLVLLSEEIEKNSQIRTKADWIKEQSSDCDIFIDDNPFICKDLITLCDFTSSKITERIRKGGNLFDVNDFNTNIKIIAPYYPAIQNQHDKRVLLVKNDLSDLKKGDF